MSGPAKLRLYESLAGSVPVALAPAGLLMEAG
jgi:hypothetical protein